MSMSILMVLVLVVGAAFLFLVIVAIALILVRAANAGRPGRGAKTTDWDAENSAQTGATGDDDGGGTGA